jgi:hypothetical protein
MFKDKTDKEMLVTENQYRAVITHLPNKNGYKASVQRRIGINEWTKVQCGLKGVVFPSSKKAEAAARHKIKEQKSLDAKINEEISYIIYDD